MADLVSWSTSSKDPVAWSSCLIHFWLYPAVVFTKALGPHWQSMSLLISFLSFSGSMKHERVLKKLPVGCNQSEKPFNATNLRSPALLRRANYPTILSSWRHEVARNWFFLSVLRWIKNKAKLDFRPVWTSDTPAARMIVFLSQDYDHQACYFFPTILFSEYPNIEQT